MALQSKTTIFINGTEINTFKMFEIYQSIDDHHVLELVCRMDVLEDLSQALGESSKNFLGETITLETSSLDDYNGYNSLEFKGIVTKVKNIKGHEASSGDSIVISAQSPSYLADDGPHYASYNDVLLSEILEQTFNGYDTSKLELAIQPKNDITLHYSVQHNESAYSYASRLAAQHGEWFYYNGTQLIFGTPDIQELELTYGFDLKEYHLSLSPQSHNYKFYANDYLLNETHEKDAKDISAGANGYSGFVSNKANTIFAKESKIWHNLYNDPRAKQRLDSSIEIQKKAIEIKQVQLTGVSDNPGVKLGSIVKIEGASYRVINVSHSNNENGDYQNHFEAITAEFDAYPNTNIQAFPRSETQTAIVMENTDPDGLGRIRVQFPWQRITGEMTPWIRIVTPHAGGDKGFHFLPEIGEEVLIGFEGGNAEHPYMLGSLYNGSGKASAFESSANDVKAIRTRSGHTIELNDTDGEEKINIYDNEGSIITFDTQAKSLYITAAETIEFQAKNIKMITEENIEFEAQGDIKTASEGDTLIVSQGTTSLQAEGDASISSSANITIEAATDASISGQNLTAEGKIAAEVKGQQTKVQGQMTVIQGASGKIDIV
ncbi:type VI secretion system Vgr family protein [Lacinutrix mariniflava]|uniref:type VI secretion system Vgr family protein n=1 Tax=Lacinutrix mariniflava TaxID=342955 RepID=UPI0006E2F2B2|nr:phage baseplate assembly protein V [Lacinutrix mariniflava]